jgi:hypothetical protein
MQLTQKTVSRTVYGANLLTGQGSGAIGAATSFIVMAQYAENL